MVGCVDPFEFEVDEVGSEPVESIVDVDLDISGRLVQLSLVRSSEPLRPICLRTVWWRHR